VTQRPIFVNTRVLQLRTEGVRRFLTEMLRGLATAVREICPKEATAGVCGHLWEQSILPSVVGSGVLWSPTNTGPLAVSRQVVTIHDLVPLDHPEWLAPRFAMWHRWLVPRIARRAAHVITVSEFTRQRLIAHTGLDPEKISVVPNGVDPRFSPSSPEDVSKVCSSLELPSSRYVLAVGAIEPRKNLGRLLEAWNLALRRLPPDVWLVIVGSLGRQTVYKNVSFNHVPERVHFVGHATDADLPALYTGALAFAYVSLYEGFGLPPLEAMACGTPVITSDRTALPEVVGTAAIMVDPFETNQIGAAIENVVLDDELRLRLSKKGLQRSRGFSWKRASDETLRILSLVAQS